jgi:hypothetical protein
MPKSELARAMDDIQKPLGLELKARRFNVRGRTFNKQLSDGLTQVINIQMGSFDPPGTTYHPGLRENLYGKFTVNLGVYVPEVAANHGGGAAKKWVRGAGGPPRTICAIILASRGDVNAARQLLLDQAKETRNPGHPAYVRGLAQKLGLGAID